MREKLNNNSETFRYVEDTLIDQQAKNPEWKPIVDEWMKEKAFDDMSKSDVLCFVYLHFPDIMKCLGRMEFLEGLQEVAGHRALQDAGLFLNPKEDRLVDKSYVVNMTDRPLVINHPDGLEVDYYGQCLITAKEGKVGAHDYSHVKNVGNASVTVDGHSFESGPHIEDPAERSRIEVMSQFENYPQFWRPIVTGALAGSEVIYERQKDRLIWQSEKTVDIVSLPYDHSTSLEKNMERLEKHVLDAHVNMDMNISEEKGMTRGR